MDGAVLCVGPAALHLRDELAALTGLPAPAVAVREFPDGEVCARVPDGLAGCDVVVVQGTHRPQDRHLLELYQLVEAAAGAGARRVLCVVPYLAFGRQDRRSRPGEPLSFDIVLRTLAMLGADRLVCVEAHNPEALLASAVPAVSLSLTPLFGEWIASCGLRAPFMLSPDAGGAGRASDVARLVGCPAGACRKVKDDAGVTTFAALPDGLAGADVVVVDDVCTTGTTLWPLAERLRQCGPASVTYLIGHLFRDAGELAGELGPEASVVGTTTVPAPGRRLSVAPLLGGAIRSWLLGGAPASPGSKRRTTE
jgi:ribose-phosphate pyrophosphokinase